MAASHAGRRKMQTGSLIGVGVAGAAVFAAAEYMCAGSAAVAPGWHALMVASKPVPTLALLTWLLTVAQDRLPDHNRLYWMLVTTSLGCALLADLVIEWSFLVGLGLFLAAHAIYIAAFVHKSADRNLMVLVAFSAVGLMFWSFIVENMRLPFDEATRLAVFAYLSVLTVMAWRAFAVARSSAAAFGTATAGQRVLWGALLFMGSDALLGVKMWLYDSPGIDLAVGVLYMSGQILIAASVLQVA